MSINKLKAFEGTLLTVLLSAWVQTVPAQTVPGGTLSPLTIPKYVTPLFIPPVLYDDGGAPMTVQVALRQINQQVLPHTFPSTPLWAYGDPANPATFNNPSFTIEATKGIATTVTWKNESVRMWGKKLPLASTGVTVMPLWDTAPVGYKGKAMLVALPSTVHVTERGRPLQVHLRVML